LRESLFTFSFFPSLMSYTIRQISRYPREKEKGS
jgi:hypothetical protein